VFDVFDVFDALDVLDVFDTLDAFDVFDVFDVIVLKLRLDTLQQLLSPNDTDLFKCIKC